MTIAPSPALHFASSTSGDEDCDEATIILASPSPADRDPASMASSAQPGTFGLALERLRALASSAQLRKYEREWSSVRRSRAGRRALLVFAFSCLVYLVHRAGMPAQAKPKTRRDRLRVYDLTDWRAVYASPHTGIARVSPGHTETFLEYLDAHFPLSDGQKAPPPHIWITLAETKYVRTGVANLDLFVRQLNSERSAKFGGTKPETRLVVLCLDDECLRECGQRQIYAYGGYERVRPQQVMRATWPKVGAFIDVLPHRDLFFVDADVSFRADPYPHLEPLMEKFDILAQENEAMEHFNTGWLWMRRGEIVAEAWRAVLVADLHVKSRDQVFFNEVLGTRELRKGFDRTDSGLRTEFTARNGLRVKILDPSLFRVYHLESLTHLKRHDSIFLHTTCADDVDMKLYIAKVEGYWQDVDGFYTRPRRLISIEHLAGSRDDVAQLFRTLLTLSYYTSRSLIPPGHVTFLDLVSDVPTRDSYAAFPLSHLAKEGYLYNVSVVEPEFIRHTTSILLGRSVLNGSGGRVDEWWRELGELERERRQRRVLALTRAVEVDMRPHASLASLLRHLTTEPTLLAADHVRLIHADWTGHQHWRAWVLPETAQSVDLCARLDELPTCDQICPFAEGRRGLKDAPPWPPMDKVV